MRSIISSRLDRPLRGSTLLSMMLVLSACAGGGGGGAGLPAGVVTEFQGRLSDVSQPVTVAPRYTELEADHTIGTVPSAATASGPHAPGGLLIDIDPPGGTVDVNRATNTFAIDFDDDTQVFASDTGASVGPAERLTMLIPGAASGFHYTSYGVWSTASLGCLFSSCFSSFLANAFFFGSPTPSSGMPNSGQATFNGTMHGFHAPDSSAAVSLTGAATLAANFGTQTLTGSFHSITTLCLCPLPSGGVSGFNDILVDAAISGGRLTGTVTDGAGGSGPLEGSFFGPGAEEVGGAFQMTGNGSTIGAFAAKQ